MQSQEALSQFLAMAKNWSQGYRKFICTYLALRRDDQWHLEHSVTSFFSDFNDETGNLFQPLEVETKSILAGRKLFEGDDLLISRTLNEIESKPFSAIHTGAPITSSNESKEDVSYYYEPMYRREFPGNWRWPALTATTSSNNNKNHLPNREQLELELRSCDTPFSGVEELFEALSIPLSCFQRGYSSPTSVWVIRHPAILLEESCMSEGNANILVKCPTTIDPQNISIGIRAFSGTEPPQRRKIAHDKIQWEENGNWLNGVVREQISEAAFADIHLNYKNEYLGHHWINDPSKSLNPRFLLHSLYDKKGVIGNSFFSQKADYFEDTISVLMSLLGLSSITYGGIPALKDAPDILVYSPIGHLYVIECTTTDVGRSGKLLKLSQRTKEIKAAALKGGLGISDIQPIMCTSLQREETKACWDEAANFNISLMCQEDIQNLINKLENPPSFQELYDSALAIIPNSLNGQENLFGNP